MEINFLRRWIIVSLIGLSFLSQAFAEEISFLDLPQDAFLEVLSNLTIPEMIGTSTVYKGFANEVPKALKIEMKSLFSELDSHFVVIPEGLLKRGVPVASFESDQYPVTQKLWQRIMGSLPDDVQPHCPNCPITHVAWENEDNSPAEVQTFLKKLNVLAEKAKLSGVVSQKCTYDLPTDTQLWYVIRGDVSGTSTAPYSVAKDADGKLIDITDANVNEYVTYNENSNGQIQPIGQKKLNALRMELGNVWKMVKGKDRTRRGGSWRSAKYDSETKFSFCPPPGSRSDDMGFSLVRRCGE